MGFNESIANIRAGIAEAARAAGRDPASVTLLAATKTRTSGEIRAAIAAGITACGENRVQELTAHLADDAYRGASVHFIGHLQTNKVKYVVGKVSLIHSVSSEKLLRAIAAQADKLGLVQDILLEINLAGEESKSGFAPEQALDAARTAANLQGVRLRGLMCIPPASGEKEENFQHFETLHQLAVDIRQKMEAGMAWN